MDEIKSITLTQRSGRLLLRHAYPFEVEKVQLRAFQEHAGTRVVNVDTFCISGLIGDLVYSEKKIRDDRLLGNLDALCSVGEIADCGVGRIRGVVIE